MTRPCPVCGIFQKDGWVVENLADEPHTPGFPEQFEKLIPLQTKDGRRDDSFLQCSKCRNEDTLDEYQLMKWRRIRPE